MKKVFALILVACLSVGFFIGLADSITIDLEDMTPAELLELKDKIEKEYSKATYVSSKIESELVAKTKEAFEEQFSDAKSFSYPLFGLSSSRARTLYKIYGNCTAKYYDNSKISYSVSAFFYYNEENDDFTLSLLMFDKDVIYKDDKTLQSIVRFIDKATYTAIKSIID